MKFFLKEHTVQLKAEPCHVALYEDLKTSSPAAPGLSDLVSRGRQSPTLTCFLAPYTLAASLPLLNLQEEKVGPLHLQFVYGRSMCGGH